MTPSECTLFKCSEACVCVRACVCEQDSSVFLEDEDACSVCSEDPESGTQPAVRSVAWEDEEDEQEEE